MGQWIYTNGDIIGGDGKLLENLRGAKIIVIAMCAPKELRDCAAALENLRWTADGVSASLRNSYRSMLEKLNYYGKYEPLEPGIK